MSDQRSLLVSAPDRLLAPHTAPQPRIPARRMSGRVLGTHRSGRSDRPENPAPTAPPVIVHPSRSEVARRKADESHGPTAPTTAPRIRITKTPTAPNDDPQATLRFHRPAFPRPQSKRWIISVLTTTDSPHRAMLCRPSAATSAQACPRSNADRGATDTPARPSASSVTLPTRR
jgi:hypothetical protein